MSNAPVEYAKKLFRQEIVDSKGKKYGATIQLSEVKVIHVLSGILAFVLFCVAFLSFTSLPRKETVSGYLAPSNGLLHISSYRTGVVDEVYFSEGDTVDEGETLVHIISGSSIENGNTSREEVTEIYDQMKDASTFKSSSMADSIRHEVAVIRENKLSLDLQIKSLGEAIQLQREKILIDESTVEDFKLLLEKQLVTELNYRDARYRLISSRRELLEMQGRRSILAHDLNVLNHSILGLLSRLEVANADSITNNLSLREKQVGNEVSNSFRLLAPDRGRITWLSVKPGDVMTVGEPIGHLMPEGSTLIAEMWVPSSAIGFIRMGGDVKIMYDSFPFQKFGSANAKIIKIAASPTPIQKIPDGHRTEEASFRVQAEIEHQYIDGYGERIYLGPGMKFKADLVLDERSLLDWFLDPILSAAKRYN